MKKIISIIAIIVLSISIYGCSNRPKLYLLNWGDYMDPDIEELFEAEYPVNLVIKIAGSNEEMASLLQAENAVYDLVVPSDYMIDKFIAEGMIQTLDFSQLPNFTELGSIETLETLYSGNGFGDYVVPYAWGTIGILYRTDVPGLEDLLSNEGWDALFLHGDEYRTGMYDSSRDAVGAALLALGYSVNSENQSELDMAETLLTNAGFTAWGEDNLKGRVLDDTLDMALVYSGDYISEYYIALDDEREINFDFYVPETTNVWMDAMVIPTIARSYDLAHTFMNFLLFDEVAMRNYEYIGYAPPYQAFYDEMYANIVQNYPDLAYSFDPYPLGSSREMYVYGSDGRSEAIVEIIQRAKTGE